ncbi:hypothetical protein M758_2G228400 [Ceratodon purpureus]|nr:hypothetical protein M758_2G228400 [Ceratodon purpureus]
MAGGKHGWCFAGGSCSRLLLAKRRMVLLVYSGGLVTSGDRVALLLSCRRFFALSAFLLSLFQGFWLEIRWCVCSWGRARGFAVAIPLALGAPRRAAGSLLRSCLVAAFHVRRRKNPFAMVDCDCRRDTGNDKSNLRKEKFLFQKMANEIFK